MALASSATATNAPPMPSARVPMLAKVWAWRETGNDATTRTDSKAEIRIRAVYSPGESRTDKGNMRLPKLTLELAAATFALVIAAFYSIQSQAAVIDPDIWWHISVGDWIIENRSVPRTGILSQHLERSWVAYSWGFDLLVATIHRFWGLPGLIGLLIGFQVLLSFVFLLVMRSMARTPAWAWLIACSSIFAFYINPLRPGLFTLLFFTLQLFVIFQAERRRDDKLLLWLAPLFVLWANTHIQFMYGLFVLGLYGMARLARMAPGGFLGVIRADRVPEPFPARCVGALAAAAACSAIGPNGVLPHIVAMEYATQIGQYQVIQELGALNFRRPEHFVQLWLLMAACIAAGRSRRADLFRVLLLVISAAVSFRAMRDSWFVSMAAAFVLAEVVGDTRAAAGERDSPPAVRPAVLYALAAVLALGVAFTLARRQGMSTPELASVIDRVYPLRATEFIKQAGLTGRMYNDFNWGGFLTYRLPQHPVSIDPRADLYDGELFAQSLRTANAAPGWEKDPDVARADFVLIQRWFQLARALANDRRFRLVYEDHVASVFVREADRR